MDTDSDNEMEWEQVLPEPLPQLELHFPEDDYTPQNEQPHHETLELTISKAPIEITIERPAPRTAGPSASDKEKSQALARERFVRLQSHRLHTIALFTSASIRNKWINDPLLHARIMSLLPLPYHTSFQMITKQNQPNAQLRGRQFEAALVRLTEWWHANFDVEEDMGIKRESFEAAAARIPPPPDLKGKGKARAKKQDDGLAEIINSEKSLMKHTLMMRGSRDLSAQLFTSLCRSLGLPSRLVVSLQGVLWRRGTGPKGEDDAEKVKEGRKVQAKKKQNRVEREARAEAAMVAAVARNSTVAVSGNGNGNGRATPPVVVDVKGKGKGKAKEVVSDEEQKAPPVIRLRKTKPQGQKLGARKPLPVLSESPPVFWTEVFSRPDGHWITVDPVRGLVGKRKKFEPASSDPFNHMLYVLAFEEDGFVRDVTPRYAKNFGTKILKERRTGIGKKDWWGDVLRTFSRPYRLNRDDVEDQEFEDLQIIEGMPSSVGGFKDHPLYALERHLKRDQVIHPYTQIGRFRGEPVFSRSDVLSLKTSENWMRSGRIIKAGEQPLKDVKVRAVTVARKRAVEMAKSEGGGAEGEVTQGMYAEWQTELYMPAPIIDGKVPKNDFGNIDLYVSSMMPEGGVHLPYKGIAKIARQLGIDYAEAVTGFEFKQRRALPILTGVVIPKERESELLEAYWESAQAAEEKERQKKQERVIHRWTRLIQGLRVRKRLQEQYADKSNGASPKPVVHEENNNDDSLNQDNGEGGFLHGLDRNVAPFSLPRNLHVSLNPAVGGSKVTPEIESGLEAIDNGFPASDTPIVIDDSDDDGMDEVIPTSSPNAGPSTAPRAPKTMTQFAEASIAMSKSNGNKRLGDEHQHAGDSDTDGSDGSEEQEDREEGEENGAADIVPETPPARPSRGTKANGKTTPTVKPKPKPKPKPRPKAKPTKAKISPSTPAATRTRSTRIAASTPASSSLKRARADSTPSPSEEEEKQESESERERKTKARAKRPERKARALAAAKVMPASTRTLRPRK